MTVSILDKAIEHRKSEERNRKFKSIFYKSLRVILSFWIPLSISVIIAALMVLVFKKIPAAEFPAKIWYFFCKSFFPSLPAMMYFICK